MMSDMIRPLVAVLSLAAMLTVLFVARRADSPASVTVVLSIDGFRPEYLTREHVEMPHLRAMAQRGVSTSLTPSFPSKTFPNHYAMITGVHPPYHGIVGNSMTDPRDNARFSLSPRQSHQRRWWRAEPLWTTQRKRGGRAITAFWPGSDLAIDGYLPDKYLRYDESILAEQRIEWLVEQLEHENSQEVRERRERHERDLSLLGLIYFEELDKAGHKYGPVSDEVDECLQRMDMLVGRLVEALDSAFGDDYNLMVVSDHGMMHVPKENRILLNAMIPDLKAISYATAPSVSPVAEFFPQPELFAEVLYNLTVGPSADTRIPWYCTDGPTVYTFQDVEMQCDPLPPRFHFDAGVTVRVAPLVGLVPPNFQLARGPWDNFHNEGVHGWDPELEDMHAVFLADGPAFKLKSQVERFPSIDVFAIGAKALGMHMDELPPVNATLPRGLMR
ncbi:MAG: hypothetical protein MHM6MM_004115 [Cercozoa sp. M6MM]